LFASETSAHLEEKVLKLLPSTDRKDLLRGGSIIKGEEEGDVCDKVKGGVQGMFLSNVATTGKWRGGGGGQLGFSLPVKEVLPVREKGGRGCLSTNGKVGETHFMNRREIGKASQLRHACTSPRVNGEQPAKRGRGNFCLGNFVDSEKEE